MSTRQPTPLVIHGCTIFAHPRFLAQLEALAHQVEALKLDTLAGARASALIYSLVETAKANNVEPYLWLRHVLRALPTATTVEHFEALLPWSLKAEQLITA
jgi:hypothetical protein